MAQIPDFYDPDQVGTLFYPRMDQIAAAAAAAEIPPAYSSGGETHLILIDMQIDFCHEGGSLTVPGAVGDLRRVIEFIFTYAAEIDKITCTLDTHLPFQIFHAAWWVNDAGERPDPMTIITAEDVEEGVWQPAVLPEYSRNYVHELERRSQKELTIWPYHVMLGGPGNGLDPALWTAVIWHALARRTQPAWVPKGLIPQTEHYSAVGPEIPVGDHPQGSKNEQFLEAVAASDRVLIAGEAESHCVLETLQDIAAEFAGQPDLLQNIFVLQDCMSPVQHPTVDFHAQAMEAFAEMADAGMQFIDSTSPEPALGHAHTAS